MRMSKSSLLFSVLTLSTIALTQGQGALPRCLTDCAGDTDDAKFCSAACYGEETDELCLCDQTSSRLNMFQSAWNYMRGLETPRIWTCTGPSCNGADTSPPDLTDEDGCKGLCLQDDNCKSYIWQQKYGSSEHTCTLLDECKSLDGVSGIEECHTCQSGRRCTTCGNATFVGGPTSVHWKCNSRTGDIYHTELPEGTLCFPSHSCPDPVVDTDTNRITCTETGQWHDENDVEQDIASIDVQCGCSELKIANSPGTLAFCETPVPPEANGDLILTEANTCVLTCDGHFVTEISCGFNEADGGTSWFSNMDNADPEIIEGGCITCLQEYCQEPETTSAPGTTNAPETSSP